jgi:lysophospholipase L1-like esterase
MPERNEPQFGLGKSIAFSLILIVLVLGLAEGAVRTWAHHLRDDIESFDSGSGTFVLAPGIHKTPMGTVKINPDGFVGAPIEPKTPDLWQIVAVGDSCTFGGGDDVDTYPAKLDLILDKRETDGHRYQVVNAGISGLNSELALNRLKSKVPALEPDVITIYIGWNDLMKFDPLSQGTASRWSGVARFLDKLWLAKGLRKLIFYYVRPNVDPPATGPESRTGRFADFRPTIYERNLRAMIAEVRRQGARPLLMTLPTVVREDMTVQDLANAHVVFPYFPSAYGVGDLLDLLGAYNRTIREVAADLDVPLFDLAARFQQIDDVTPLFYDTMHTNSRGLQVIANLLSDALERDGLLAPAAASPAASTAATGG